MLSCVQQHSEPFAFFTCDDALPPALLEQLLHLFDEELAWQHHHDSFYKAHLCEIGDRLPASSRAALLRRMAHITGLPRHEGGEAILKSPIYFIRCFRKYFPH